MKQQIYLVKALPPVQLAAVTVHDALQNCEALSRLTALVQESSARLKAVESLIPGALRCFVKAGPIDGGTWCLLVSSGVAAAKLRQLTPLMQARLVQNGWVVTAIRLKVLVKGKTV